MNLAEQITSHVTSALKSFFSSGAVELPEMTQLKADLAAAQSQAEALKTENAQLKTDLAAAQSAHVASQKENEALKASQTKFDEKVEETAAKKASQAVAAVGITIKDVKVLAETGKPSQEQLFEQFNKITDPKERGAFYLKHFSGNRN
jgi:FtsZ-binding cell division protein ZapB